MRLTTLLSIFPINRHASHYLTLHVNHWTPPLLSIFIAACAAASVSAVPIIPRVCTPARLDQDKLLSSGPGPDVKIKSMDECQQWCLDHDGCTGYQWYNASPMGWTTDPVCQVTNMPTGVKSSQYPTGPVMISRCRSLDQEAADYPGLDIGNAPAADVADCAFQCDDRADCFAFTWAATYNNGTCFMKSDRPAAVGGPFDGSLLSGTARKCLEPRMDYDMAELTQKTVSNRPHWKDCVRDCKTYQYCQGFSWSNYQGGTCWLKHSDVLNRQFTFQKKVGVVSAVCM